MSSSLLSWLWWASSSSSSSSLLLFRTSCHKYHIVLYVCATNSIHLAMKLMIGNRGTSEMTPFVLTPSGSCQSLPPGGPGKGSAFCRRDGPFLFCLLPLSRVRGKDLLRDGRRYSRRSSYNLARFGNLHIVQRDSEYAATPFVCLTSGPRRKLRPEEKQASQHVYIYIYT